MSVEVGPEPGRGDAKRPMPCGICLELMRFAAFMSGFLSEFLFCRPDIVREHSFQPAASVSADASGLTSPFRRAGRNDCNLYNIISKCPECKLKWRKSQDLFASKRRYSVRCPAPDGNLRESAACMRETNPFRPAPDEAGRTAAPEQNGWRGPLV